jgi:hypothetical protein
MAGKWSFFQEEFSCASCALHFHHSWEDYLTINFCRCLILGKVGEYSRVAKAF